jgi:hypothetical protein
MEPNVKPLWESATFWGVVITALSGLLGRYGIDITPEDTKSLSAALVAAATPLGILVGLVVTIWGRVRATRKVALVPPKGETLSALAGIMLAAGLAVTLSACSLARLDGMEAGLARAERAALRIGGALYAVECKSGPLPGVLGAALAATAVIVAPDSRAAARIGAAVDLNDRLVASVCPAARAIEVVIKG